MTSYLPFTKLSSKEDNIPLKYPKDCSVNGVTTTLSMLNPYPSNIKLLSFTILGVVITTLFIPTFILTLDSSYPPNAIEADLLLSDINWTIYFVDLFK